MKRNVCRSFIILCFFLFIPVLVMAGGKKDTTEAPSGGTKNKNDESPKKTAELPAFSATILATDEIQFTLDWTDVIETARGTWGLYETTDTATEKDPLRVFVKITNMTIERPPAEKAASAVSEKDVTGGIAVKPIIQTLSLQKHFTEKIYTYKLLYVREGDLPDKYADGIEQKEPDVKKGEKLPPLPVVSNDIKITFPTMPKWSASLTNKNYIELTATGWVKPSENYTYYLYRRVGRRVGAISNDYTCVSEIPYATTAYRDEDILPGQDYAYKLFFAKDNAYKQYDGTYKEFKDPYPSDVTMTSAAGHGVYVGVIKFAQGADDITLVDINGTTQGGLLPLDTQPKVNALKQSIERAYTLSPVAGTAFYYGLNKALVNTETNLNSAAIPTNTRAVTVIGITDGIDNSSANPALKPLSSRSFTINDPERDIGRYADYIKLWNESNIITTNSNKKIPVKIYILGIGDDSEGEKFTDMTRLNKRLQELAGEILERNTQTALELQLPAYWIGAHVRVVFRNSNEVIEFVVGGGDDAQPNKMTTHPTLSIVPELSDYTATAERNTVTAIHKDDSYAYIFSFAGSLPKAADIYIINAEKKSIPDPEASALIYDERYVKRESEALYFVLDASKTLGANIDSVRNMVFEMIDTLFNSNVRDDTLVTRTDFQAAPIVEQPTLTSSEPTATSTRPTPISSEPTPVVEQPTPLSSVQVPPSTVQEPVSTVQVSPSTVQMPSSTVQEPPSTVQEPVSTVQMPSSTVQVPTSSVQMPSSTVQVPPSTVQTPPFTPPVREKFAGKTAVFDEASLAALLGGNNASGSADLWAKLGLFGHSSMPWAELVITPAAESAAADWTLMGLDNNEAIYVHAAVKPVAAPSLADYDALIAKIGSALWTPQRPTLPLGMEGSSLAYWVQIGAYETPEKALRDYHIILSRHDAAAVRLQNIADGSGYPYKLRLGPYASKEEAVGVIARLHP